jgi:pimeloyl-ACP methyl ester carboxylesterase
MGWSDGSPGSYAFADLGEELIRFLDVLGLDRVRLVGHDWGLGLGYLAAIAHPERFSRFVPMAGPHVWALDGGSLELWWRPWHVYAISSLGRSATRLGVPEACLRTWRAAGSFTPEEIAIYTAPLHRPGSVDATVRHYRTFLFRDVPFFVRRHDELFLRVPTLHLNGELDPLSRGTPDTYGRHAEDMRLEVVRGAGHFLAEERPAEVTERILDFLA